MNICGCLVHTTPELASATSDEIAAFDGVEVYAQTSDGKIVVVVEDTPARLASETIMALHQVPGIITLTLTYHHFEELGNPKAGSPIQSLYSIGGSSHEHF